MNKPMIYKIPEDLQNITDQKPAYAYLTQTVSWDIISYLEQQGVVVGTKDAVDTIVQDHNKPVSVINFNPEVKQATPEPPRETRQEPVYETPFQQETKPMQENSYQEPVEPAETCTEAKKEPVHNFPQSDLYRNMSRRAYTIASFSTKGGVGKTAVATNLGAVYAQSGKKTILVDLDIGTGNAADVIGVKNSQVTVENWRQYARNLPSSVQKHSSGLYILPCGPNDFEMAGEDVEDLLDILASNFEYILLDYGTKPFFPHTKRGLEIADKIYVISTQEQGMVQTLVSRFLAEHEDWIQSGKASLVVNRVSPLGYYKPSDIAKMANFKNWHEIPDDPQGFEAAKRAKSTPVQLNAMSANAFYSMTGEETVKKSGKGFFRKLFAR